MPPPTFGPGKMPLTTPVPTQLATPLPNAFPIPPCLPGRTCAPPNPGRKRLGPEAIETECTDEVREGFGPGFHQVKEIISETVPTIQCIGKVGAPDLKIINCQFPIASELPWLFLGE